MKIFIGTAIPAATSQDLGTKLREELAGPFWRMAPVTQWHVTTVFIGERRETVIPALSGAIARLVADHPPIWLQHGRIVTMPKKEPTMLWVRFQPNPALTALHVSLAQATGTGPSIYRPYWPHITLARAKAGHPRPVDGPVVLPLLVIDHLTLFHSTPSSAGSVHHPIASWPLSGRGPVAPVVVD